MPVFQREVDGRTDGQTEREGGRTDIHTDRQTDGPDRTGQDRKADGQTERQTGRQLCTGFLKTDTVSKSLLTNCLRCPGLGRSSRRQSKDEKAKICNETENAQAQTNRHSTKGWLVEGGLVPVRFWWWFGWSWWWLLSSSKSSGKATTETIKKKATTKTTKTITKTSPGLTPLPLTTLSLNAEQNE